MAMLNNQRVFQTKMGNHTFVCWQQIFKITIFFTRIGPGLRKIPIVNPTPTRIHLPFMAGETPICWIGWWIQLSHPGHTLARYLYPVRHTFIDDPVGRLDSLEGFLHERQVGERGSAHVLMVVEWSSVGKACMGTLVLCTISSYYIYII